MMRALVILWLLLGAGVDQRAIAAEAESFLGAHPGLQKYGMADSPSRFSVGVGLVPVGVMGNRFFVGIDAVQINYANSVLDWELLSALIGLGVSQNSASSAKYAMLLTKPKLRVTENISVGFLGGYEYLVFPNLPTLLVVDNGYITPSQPFSRGATVYGVAASEYIKTSATGRLKVTEMLLKETYSVDKTGNGLRYDFSKAGADFNSSTIAASSVFMIEVGLLF